jgi:4-hydroxy-3-polyprenylbenzoate decarboxylase
VLCVSAQAFSNYTSAAAEMQQLNEQLNEQLAALAGIAIIVVCDDAAFTAATLNNYLWVTYTRCNPSHDIHGIAASTTNKHWGCAGPLVIDARIKPHHAPPLVKDAAVEQRINHFFEKGGPLYGVEHT